MRLVPGKVGHRLVVRLVQNQKSVGINMIRFPESPSSSYKRLYYPEEYWLITNCLALAANNHSQQGGSMVMGCRRYHANRMVATDLLR
jgi:hypothetical protein